ncbi:MAG: GNAT family N-acetyltransferase [Anaerolineaceae bacterium]
MLTIRDESIDDVYGVQWVNSETFETMTESELVDTLRENDAISVSMVADLDGRVVGHILFSEVAIGPHPYSPLTLGLAPMAVLPEMQNRGIGSMLVKEGLERCRQLGAEIVIVLGHPNFYPHFGFEPCTPKGITYNEQVPEDAFMAVELVPGALQKYSGVVHFQPEFEGV